MTFRIGHGLIECTNYPGSKKSAIIFDDSFILTSAGILYPYLLKCSSALSDSTQTTIIEALRSQKAIIHENEFLQSCQMQITFDHHKMQSKARHLRRFKAKILYVHTCTEILVSVENILKFLTKQQGSDDIAAYNNSLHQLTMSSFIILQVMHPQKPAADLKSLLVQMRNYLKFVDPIDKLEDVLTISTPFGMESFYKTVNVGKISNVFGMDLCLFSISNSLVSGCEGAAVINSRLRLIGIIICTTFQWNQHNTNFTLAANLRNVLSSFLRQIGETYTHDSIVRKPLSPHWESSVVLLRNKGSWGTGTLVNIQNSKIILTCSHAIKDPNEKIYIHYKGGLFEGSLVWQNPNHNQPYDIAIIKIPIFIPDRYFSKLSNIAPYIGQLVYSAGFPLTSELGKNVFRPSLYPGRIVKISPGMIIADASVQAGQSGGPLLDASGQLVGVSISNSKDDETNIIHPNVNMSVPIFSIKKDLEKFASTQDVQVLNNLIAGIEVQNAWALKGPRVECKL